MTQHRDDLQIPDIECTAFVLMVDELVHTDPQQWGPVIDKHLTDCPPCLVYLQQMLDLQTLLGHVHQGQRLSDDEVARVLATINVS